MRRWLMLGGVILAALAAVYFLWGGKVIRGFNSPPRGTQMM